MTQELLSAYNLRKEDFEIIPFGNGLINTTWRMKSAQRDLILQRINHAVFKTPFDIASNMTLLSEYLKDVAPDYLFTVPIKTKDNNALYQDESGYYRLTDYVPNSRTIDTVGRPQQAYEAARQFGKFTKILAGFPAEKLKITLPDFHNLALRYTQFQEALKTGNKNRIEESKGLIEFIDANREIVTTYEKILENPAFKLRVTHHDTKISNVLFNADDRGLCVIDLDTVMPGYFISDVGDMMRTYLSPVNEEEKDFSKIEVRNEYFKAIYQGYMNDMENELTKSEKEHFVYAGKFMIYMQAMRFLTDYINNDVYYGSRYEGHNFVRAGNQAVLLQRLMEKEGELNRIAG